MGLKLVTAPAEQPITLAQAKMQCRATEFTDDDTLIELFIDAAVDFVDGPSGFLGRALIDQTWDYYLDAFPTDSGPIEIPLPPLIEVIGLFYQDGDGVEQEWTSTNYRVDASGEPGKISLGSGVSWPTPITEGDAVRIRFRAGYLNQIDSPAVESVPGAIKAALLVHVADLYANRESAIVGQTVAKLPWTAEQLLRRYRFYLGMA
jgi:uncharacterized phiE125 gp8 family phage protein